MFALCGMLAPPAYSETPDTTGGAHRPQRRLRQQAASGKTLFGLLRPRPLRTLRLPGGGVLVLDRPPRRATLRPPPPQESGICLPGSSCSPAASVYGALAPALAEAEVQGLCEMACKMMGILKNAAEAAAVALVQAPRRRLVWRRRHVVLFDDPPPLSSQRRAWPLRSVARPDVAVPAGGALPARASRHRVPPGPRAARPAGAAGTAVAPRRNAGGAKLGAGPCRLWHRRCGGHKRRLRRQGTDEGLHDDLVASDDLRRPHREDPPHTFGAVHDNDAEPDTPLLLLLLLPCATHWAPLVRRAAGSARRGGSDEDLAHTAIYEVVLPQENLGPVPEAVDALHHEDPRLIVPLELPQQRRRELQGIRRRCARRRGPPPLPHGSAERARRRGHRGAAVAAPGIAVPAAVASAALLPTIAAAPAAVPRGPAPDVGPAHLVRWLRRRRRLLLQLLQLLPQVAVRRRDLAHGRPRSRGLVVGEVCHRRRQARRRSCGDLHLLRDDTPAFLLQIPQALLHLVRVARALRQHGHVEGLLRQRLMAQRRRERRERLGEQRRHRRELGNAAVVRQAGRRGQPRREPGGDACVGRQLREGL
mmetsp:Transcript_65220/g.182377  ORF Transcript_65220/g.182377 Transcript_65220/m.182377 type:complete len:590 (+) Transcript_65220:101-1870(+)